VSSNPNETAASGAAPSLKPSWIDRITGWIDRLPGPNSPYYVVAVAALGLLMNAGFWIDGSLPFGIFESTITAFAFFVFYWLALYHYLTLVGSRSLRRFRPLLQADNAQILRYEYELTQLPRAQGWVGIALGVVWGVLSVVTEPEPFGKIVPNTLLPYALDIGITAFLIATFWCVMVRSVRQLRTVSTLHRQAGRIDLLNLEPVHAFSSLTSRTGIGVMLLLILTYLYDPLRAITLVDALLWAVIGGLAAAIFVLPIMGVRQRLEEEKSRALDETSRVLRAAREIVHSKVMRNDLSDMKEAQAALAALVLERELYQKASTWPWDTVSIRTFASALLLPIVIWIVTRLLERLL